MILGLPRVSAFCGRPRFFSGIIESGSTSHSGSSCAAGGVKKRVISDKPDALACSADSGDFFDPFGGMAAGSDRTVALPTTDPTD